MKEQREAKRRTGGDTDSSSGIFSEAVDARLGEEPASSPPSSCRRSDRSSRQLADGFPGDRLSIKVQEERQTSVMAAHGVLVMERRMGVEQVGTYQKKHKEGFRQRGEGRTDWIRRQISEFGERGQELSCFF